MEADSPNYWRGRALWCRAKALRMRGEACRKTLLSLVDQMEALAIREEVRRTNHMTEWLAVQRIKNELYHKGLAWIVENRGGHNGRWPPHRVTDCHLWQSVRMLASVHDLTPSEVAADLVNLCARDRDVSRETQRAANRA